MNRLTDPQLLRDYTERRSEAAFAELVRRHVDLVYSAALRMVRDAQVAEDVTQGVFVALAQTARQLADRPVLSGWLHRTAQNLAANAVRSDVRRRAREQEAAAMSELLSAEPDTVWEHIAPHLDAALGELSEPDRDALLLRYFERKSAREMAQTLGLSEDAAQKRVSRAVERLREFFAKRGVTIGASGLVVVISANAVQAAPIGLVATISTAVALAGTTLAATTTATAIKTIAMTTLQKTVITATVAILAGAGIYEARQASTMRSQVQTLQQQQAPLGEQVRQLTRERDDARRQLAALRDDNERLKRNTGELPKLRGDVTRLKGDLQERSSDQKNVEAASWKDRVKRLKARLEQKQDAKIPEMELLTEKDWLRASEDELETEADYGRALSQLRSYSERLFLINAQGALKKYLESNNDQFPSDLSKLKPYFESPVAEAILERYEVLPTSSLGHMPSDSGDWVITLKYPIDAERDQRWYILRNGMGTTIFEVRK